MNEFLDNCRPEVPKTGLRTLEEGTESNMVEVIAESHF